jgi:hypothetical protein
MKNLFMAGTGLTAGIFAFNLYIDQTFNASESRNKTEFRVGDAGKTHLALNLPLPIKKKKNNLFYVTYLSAEMHER